MPDQLTQPELLSDADLAEIEAGLVAAVSRPDAERYTGKIIERQVELVDAILRAAAEGQSQRAIARAYRLGRNTVSRVIDRAVHAGKLEPHKQAAIAAGWRIVRKSQELIEEWIDTDQIKPAQLAAVSVTMGVNADKIAGWSGEAGLVVEHRHTVDVEGYRAQLEAIRERLAVSGAVSKPPSAGHVVDVQEVGA